MSAAVKRLMNDVKEFYLSKDHESTSAGCYIVCAEDNIRIIHALIIGPDDTPYEKGFFYLVLKYPDDYPLRPPAVEFMTTNGKTVRFNPNFYSSGRICLSILNTWAGQSWSPSLTISSTLMSIQSLMDAKPYHNEPGYEKTSSKYLRIGSDSNASHYSDIITHETLRVAVNGMLQENSWDARNMPVTLKDVMISHFKSNCQFYEDLIQSKQDTDGELIKDPFSDIRPPTFQYKQILTKFNELKAKYLQDGEHLPERNVLEIRGNYNDVVKNWLSKCSSPGTFVDVSNAVSDESDNDDEGLLYDPEDSDTEESEGDTQNE